MKLGHNIDGFNIDMCTKNQTDQIVTEKVVTNTNLVVSHHFFQSHSILHKKWEGYSSQVYGAVIMNFTYNMQPTYFRVHAENQIIPMLGKLVMTLSLEAIFRTFHGHFQ